MRKRSDRALGKINAIALWARWMRSHFHISQEVFDQAAALG
ncbi:hypothetical protein [Coleofasciculus sp. FACHB-129]|nr:hypothetical protein [Coleofasciculus sp. FACHB-129]